MKKNIYLTSTVDILEGEYLLYSPLIKIPVLLRKLLRKSFIKGINVKEYLVLFDIVFLLKRADFDKQEQMLILFILTSIEFRSSSNWNDKSIPVSAVIINAIKGKLDVTSTKRLINRISSLKFLNVGKLNDTDLLIREMNNKFKPSKKFTGYVRNISSIGSSSGPKGPSLKDLSTGGVTSVSKDSSVLDNFDSSNARGLMKDLLSDLGVT